MDCEIVDLDSQDVRAANGQRVTEATVADMLAVVNQAKRRRGRPSLSAPGARSPVVTVRLPESVNAGLATAALAQRKSRSQVAREAIEAHLQAL